MQTIKLGVTGGIGSGKSIVSKLLHTMGIPVYISDTESKRLTVADPQIRSSLIELLGTDVYINGELNKTLLANYLFETPEHAQTINNIIHPRVKADFRRWVEQHPAHKIVGIESAILIEAGFAAEVDSTLLVYAPQEIRIARTMKRDKCTEESVKRRIAQQMSDEEKKAFSEFIVTNDGKEALIPQVTEVVKKLLKSSNP